MRIKKEFVGFSKLWWVKKVPISIIINEYKIEECFIAVVCMFQK